MIISVDPNGNMTAIYDDELTDLFQEGSVTIRRASNVEADKNGQWWAEMLDGTGTKLGPFTKRQDALDAEKEYLERKLFG